MRALIIAIALVAALAVVAAAEDPTSTVANTFFGIDRNDKEAIKAKHEELADEQYKRMFGEDHPLPDFSGNLEPEPAGFTQKIREAVKKFSDLFKGKPISTTTTTTEPTPME